MLGPRHRLTARAVPCRVVNSACNAHHQWHLAGEAACLLAIETRDAKQPPGTVFLRVFAAVYVIIGRIRRYSLKVKPSVVLGMSAITWREVKWRGKWQA